MERANVQRWENGLIVIVIVVLPLLGIQMMSLEQTAAPVRLTLKPLCTSEFITPFDMGLVARKSVFRRETTKAQTSPHFCAVWSAPLLLSYMKVSYRDWLWGLNEIYVWFLLPTYPNFFNPTLSIKMVFGEKIPKMGTFSGFVTIFFVKCYNKI